MEEDDNDVEDAFQSMDEENADGIASFSEPED